MGKREKGLLAFTICLIVLLGLFLVFYLSMYRKLGL